MNNEKKAYLVSHFCVFLWGFTAILGKLITLNAVSLVFFRMGMAATVFLLLPTFWGNVRSFSTKDFLRFFGIGAIVCLHWLCFYGSIKLSNASIGVVLIALTAVFTAMMEPFFFQRKLIKTDLLFGLLMVPAMLLIAQSVPRGYLWGIILGVISSLLAATFSILNKKYGAEKHPFVVTWSEMTGGFLFCSIVFAGMLFWRNEPFVLPDKQNIFYLIFMVVFCTVLPFILSIWSLRHISAFTAVFLVNLEPLYGITLAYFIFHENKEMGWGFYVGAVIILASVGGKFLLERNRRI